MSILIEVCKEVLTYVFFALVPEFFTRGTPVHTLLKKFIHGNTTVTPHSVLCIHQIWILLNYAYTSTTNTPFYKYNMLDFMCIQFWSSSEHEFQTSAAGNSRIQLHKVSENFDLLWLQCQSEYSGRWSKETTSPTASATSGQAVTPPGENRQYQQQRLQFQCHHHPKVLFGKLHSY